MPDLSKACLNASQQRYLAKDQYKSDQADTLICTPGSGGASGEYARLWIDAGLRVNPGRYTGWETVFITTNGKRRGRKPAHVAEIKRAAQAGCVFLTDARCRRPEGGNPYNIGEQEVADLLRSLGYRGRVEHNGLVARWTPDGESSMSLPTSGEQCLQEIVMIKLHASYSKKVPGAEQYSSDSASASVEIELPEGAPIPAKLAELWDVTRSAVEQQLGQRPVNRMAQGNGNGYTQPAPGNGYGRNGNGNGRGQAAMSDKQRGFIRSLIGELKPLGCDYPFVEALCQRLFQRGMDHLDRAQASTLIGHLGDIKAGRVTVQQLAA